MPQSPSTPATQPATAVLQHHGHPDAAMRLEVIRHDRPARVRRAIQTLAIGWGCAIAAVFIPLLHFILVPLLLVGGPVLALQKLGERVTMVSAEGHCPACAAPLTFRLGEAVRERLALRCTACGRALVLLPDPGLLAKD